jgi:hypothetical protein
MHDMASSAEEGSCGTDAAFVHQAHPSPPTHEWTQKSGHKMLTLTSAGRGTGPQVRSAVYTQMNCRKMLHIRVLALNNCNMGLTKSINALWLLRQVDVWGLEGIAGRA